MTDLTKLTVDQLRAEILVPENGVTFAEATNELARRAQANDTLRLAAQEAVYQGLTERDNGVIELTPGEPLRARLLVLRNALAAAPAPSSSGAPAPADSQREAAIEAWRDMAMQDSMDADGNYVGFTPCAEGVGTPDELFALRREEIDEAVSLMRSAPPAPVAPVTEGEVEAAISLFGGAAIGQCDEATYNGRKDALRALIARRVAEARGAGLRDLRARLVDFCRIRDRGYDVRSDFSPLWVLDEIDRLLAAPPASKLAEETAQEPWREKLRVATNRMVDAAGYAASSAFSDVDYDLKDVRDFVLALREQVESQARRIEALENNKEAGK